MRESKVLKQMSFKRQIENDIHLYIYIEIKQRFINIYTKSFI